jgi:hypothetical protein
MRQAAVDFYYNGWAFLGANLAFGVVLLAALYGSLYVSPWLVSLVAALVVPAAGTMRMATRLRRDGHTDLGDFAEPLRMGRILLMGLAQLLASVVLAADIAIALSWGSWIGIVLLVGAVYGIVALWALSVVAWPILLDPGRDADSIRGRLRLAVVTVVLEPRRVAVLAVASAAVLGVATLLLAPILTVAVSYVWLLIAGSVLPLVDRVEERLPAREPRRFPRRARPSGSARPRRTLPGMPR